jgi:ABC-type nickel/cobalt efflux system permease component RcnA
MEELFKNMPFLFGLLAALIHVLSGPDHLAAVGPLAFNTKIRSWLIGMSWGFGHIFGMLLIGILFFFFKDLIPVEFISTNSDRIVGIMLIVIGIWAFYRLYRQKTKEKHEHYHIHSTPEGDTVIHSHPHKHNKPLEPHSHKQIEKQTVKTALGIGTIHGLAGVSHIIALLPTLAFASKTGSIFYLLGFAAGTITAMVSFSFVMGLIAHYTGKKQKPYAFTIFSGITASCAIIVGFYWIWLNY